MDREQLVSQLARRYDVLVGVGPWRSWEIGGPAWSTARLHGWQIRNAGVRTDVPPAWLVDVSRWQWIGRAARSINGARYRFLLGADSGKFACLVFGPQYWPQLQAAKPGAIVYHVYDNFRKMPNWNSNLEQLDCDLLESADVVTATSRNLCELLAKISGRRVEFLPNGVDYELFGKPVEEEPADLQAVPRPRIGYTGRINRKVDFELLHRLARVRPDWNFVLVGPVENLDAESEGWYRRCLDLSNMHFLDSKPVRSLPAYVANMDVNIMCYARRDNLWTHWIYPLKLHEYLATGRPVVSTDLDSVREFSAVVRIASTFNGWIDGIECSLRDSDPERMAARSRIASNNSWESRANLLDHWIREAAELHCAR